MADPSLLVFQALIAAMRDLGAPLRPTSTHAAVLADALLARGCTLAGVSRETKARPVEVYEMSPGAWMTVIEHRRRCCNCPAQVSRELDHADYCESTTCWPDCPACNTAPEGRPAEPDPRYLVPLETLFHIRDWAGTGWSWRCHLPGSTLDDGYVHGACRYDHNAGTREQLVAEVVEHLARWHNLHPSDAPLHEVTCPSCSATIRARMADAPPADDLIGEVAQEFIDAFARNPHVARAIADAARILGYTPGDPGGHRGGRN